MTSSPLISILINNYNYGRFLRDAIDSALNQTYANTEVIVVDDGSTDDSREIIASYGNRIIAIVKKNGGQASAFNAGFTASRGNWICFLDSDDIFAPAKISQLIRYTRRFPEAGFVAHNLGYCDGAGKAASFVRASFSQIQLVDNRESARRGKLRVVLPPTSALCLRRDVLTQVLPMPSDIAITADNYIKFAALALTPTVTLPEVLATQRIHGRNLYTLETQTESSRIRQSLVEARIAYRLRENFPFLSKLAWKSYGRALRPLLMSRHPEARRTLLTVRKEYNLLDCAPLSLYYIGGAVIKDLVRQLR